MVKKRRNILIVVIVAVVVAGAIIGNLGLDRKDRTEVTVDEVERATLVARVSGPGRVQAETTVQISSSLMGRVVDLGVDEGDVVERGQFLLRLEDVYYRSQVAQAQARLERSEAECAVAERELSDVEQQFERDLVSEKEREDFAARAVSLRQSCQEAKAALRAANDQLEKTVFHSPIAGVVTRLSVEEGENVVSGLMNQPGTVIMTISDLSDMEVEVEIDETDIVDVEIGQQAEIEIEALVDTILPGVVTEVGNSGITSMAGTQEEVTNFLVTVAVTKSHPALRPGMSATVEIITAEHPDVLNVPIQAIVTRTPTELEETADKKESEAAKDEPKGKRSDREEEDEIEGVFVVDENDQAQFVPVTSGIADELSIEVRGELEEGQRVVSGPYKVLRKLKNGEDLKLEEQKSDEKEE
ncbi:MAG: efflux RND transporter periplasmic adaptor subunit [Candidatus Eisenbacteria bacterium]|nr:efflux RND transporter periplasmic adaptor subunit [Candidatus Eisenbacteria bacterium]